jgi:hypothetical protein
MTDMALMFTVIGTTVVAIVVYVVVVADWVRNKLE